MLQQDSNEKPSSSINHRCRPTQSSPFQSILILGSLRSHSTHIHAFCCIFFNNWIIFTGVRLGLRSGAWILSKKAFSRLFLLLPSLLRTTSSSFHLATESAILVSGCRLVFAIVYIDFLASQQHNLGLSQTPSTNHGPPARCRRQETCSGDRLHSAYHGRWRPSINARASMQGYVHIPPHLSSLPLSLLSIPYHPMIYRSP